MSPSTINESRPLSSHPQRPWRAVEQSPRRMSRTAERTFCAPVVRELRRRVRRGSPSTPGDYCAAVAGSAPAGPWPPGAPA